MKILEVYFRVTHTVVELQNEGFEVVIVDDLLIRR
jgi:hypothetical protein